MKSLFFLFSLVFCLLGSEPIQNGIVSYGTELKSNGKDSILIFGTEGCPYCKTLQEDLNTHPPLKELAQKANVWYIPMDKEVAYSVEHNGSMVPTNNYALRLQIGARASPTVVLFDEKWKMVMTIPGYSLPAQMRVYLRYLIEDIYQNTPLEEYLKQEGLL